MVVLRPAAKTMNGHMERPTLRIQSVNDDDKNKERKGNRK